MSQRNEVGLTKLHKYEETSMLATLVLKCQCKPKEENRHQTEQLGYFAEPVTNVVHYVIFHQAVLRLCGHSIVFCSVHSSLIV